MRALEADLTNGVEPAAGGGPLPENVLEVSVAQRPWSGATIEVTTARFSGRVLQHLGHADESRLKAVLEEVGGVCEPRLREGQPCPAEYTPRHMFYAPAGVETWGYAADIRFVKDASLVFDLPTLERLGVAVDAGALGRPRLRFADERIWTLVNLLADAVDDPDPSMQVYGDGLVAAIAARTFARHGDPAPAPERGLAPWQLRRVVEYLEAHLCRRIELSEVASLVGYSQWHFSRAFKVSTGKAPYRWLIDARIKRAQTMMVHEPFATLDSVAEATGFSDAAHFSRTFRKTVGVSPGAWRKGRLR